jgi:CMP-N,N'-diacetyllegionaminic acid synthase
MKVLCVIPARGGSKRIKNKNLKLFLGKPLLSYVVNEVKKSKVADKIIVSTDSKKIQNYAIKIGAESPFLRPKKISKDVPTDDVSIHALKYFLKKKQFYDLVITLEPPAVARKAKHISEAVNFLKKNKNYDSYVTAVIASERPEWMFKIISRKLYPVTNYFIDKYRTLMKFPSSMIFTKTYRPIGILFATKADSLIKYNSLVGKKCFPKILDKKYDIDLDYPSDWSKAEKKISL